MMALVAFYEGQVRPKPTHLLSSQVCPDRLKSQFSQVCFPYNTQKHPHSWASEPPESYVKKCFCFFFLNYLTNRLLWQQKTD